MKAALFLISMCLFFSSQGQTQLGQTLQGDSLQDQSGHTTAISADGNRIAIGHIGSQRVKIYAYNENNMEWDQIGQTLSIVGFDWALDESLAMSSNGNILAIGAMNNIPDNNHGYVRVFRYSISEQEWQQIGADLQVDIENLEFGSSVSLSADGLVLAVGTRLNNGGSSYGSTYVYAYKPDSAHWTQMGQTLTTSYSADINSSTVALDDIGEKLIVAYPRANGTGVLFSYTWDENMQMWVQRGSELSGTDENEHFGWSIDLNSDGNTAIIGSPSASGNGASSGRIYMYTWSTSNEDWILKGTTIDGDDPGDALGTSVSISGSGNIIVSGTQNGDGKVSNEGEAILYKWNAVSENWVQLGERLYGDQSRDYFGWSVALSSNGKRVLVGAPQQVTIPPAMGYTRVFQMDSVLNIRELKVKSDIAIYPNPSRAIFNITNTNDVRSMRLTSLDGSTIRIQKTVEGPHQQLDLSGLPLGIYFLRMQMYNGTEVISRLVLIH